MTNDTTTSAEREKILLKCRILTILKNDSEYLLRCAHTYDWESIIEFCSFLLPTLVVGTSRPTTSCSSTLPTKRKTNNTTTTQVMEDDDNEDDDGIEHTNHKRSRSRCPLLPNEGGVGNPTVRLDRKLLDSIRSQLYNRDQWGNTVLHAACYNRPPLQVIQCLLQLSNGIPSTCYEEEAIQLHTFLSRDYSTPLLVACATGASKEIIKELLILSSATTTNNKNQQEEYTELIHGGFLVSVSDQLGSTPLSELVIQYQLLLQSNLYNRQQQPSIVLPSLDKVTQEDIRLTKNINTSISNAPFYDIFWIKVLYLLRAAWSFEFPKHPLSLDIIQDHTNTTTTTTTTTTIQEGGGSVLHGMAIVAETCPPLLTNLICNLFSDSIDSKYSTTTTTTNNNTTAYPIGLLPLHLALLPTTSRMRGIQLDLSRRRRRRLNTTTNNNDDYKICKRNMIYRRTYFIQTLLSLSQKGKTTTTPTTTAMDKKLTKDTPINLARELFPVHHRTPLCQAIAGGFTWHIFNMNTTTKQTTPKKSSMEMGIVQLLYHEAPEYVLVPDTLTGYYPFQLAVLTCQSKNSTRSGGSCSSSITHCQERETPITTHHHIDDEDEDEKDEDESLLQLDTFYNLLRLHPQQIC